MKAMGTEFEEIICENVGDDNFSELQGIILLFKAYLLTCLFVYCLYSIVYS